MPKGEYKHKSLAEQGIKTRSLGFRDGRLLDEIEIICKNPLIMNLAPDNCRGKVYKTIWWAMKYLLQMAEARTIRREAPLFPEMDESVEVKRLQDRVLELETLENGYSQTIDDLMKQLKAKNTEIAKLKQVDYTVKWDDVIEDSEIKDILNYYKNFSLPSRRVQKDGKELASDLFKELWKFNRMYEVIFTDEHSELPTVEKLEELTDKALRKKNQ